MQQGFVLLHAIPTVIPQTSAVINNNVYVNTNQPNLSTFVVYNNINNQNIIQSQPMSVSPISHANYNNNNTIFIRYDNGVICNVLIYDPSDFNLKQMIVHVQKVTDTNR